MYKSGFQVDRKLDQVRFYLKRLEKFENRVFVHGGRDEETGSYPLRDYLTAFITSARSILQYAHKEATATGRGKVYDAYVSESAIIKCFRELRNLDIHEAVIGTRTTITASSVIGWTSGGAATTGWVPFDVEDLNNLDDPKGRSNEAAVMITIQKPIEITPELINEVNREGRKDLMDAVRNGKPLYTDVECNGEKDLFRLCRMYLNDLERFVEYGKKEGFIS